MQGALMTETFNTPLPKRTLLFLFFVMLLAGCGGSSDTKTDTVNELSPEGLWLGYQTVHEISNGAVVSNVFDMKTIVYDGRFVGVSEDANIFFSGSYKQNNLGNMYADSLGSDSETGYKMYSIDSGGAHWTDGIVRLSVVEKSSLEGSFYNKAQQEGEIESVYSSLSEKGASLEYIAADITSANYAMTIAVDGTVSGVKSGCTIDGTFRVPDAAINIYEMDYMLSGCDKAGSYSGLGALAVSSDSQVYFTGFSVNSDETVMDGTLFYLDKTPEAFTVSATPSAVMLFDAAAGYLYDYSEWYYVDEWDSSLNDKKYSFLEDHNFFKYTVRYNNEYVIMYENSFKKSSFVGLNFKENNVYGAFSNSFVGANLKDVTFNTEKCFPATFTFIGLISDEVYDYDDCGINFNDFSYANLEGTNLLDTQHTINDFSDAWWVDGSRCGLDVDGVSAEDECPLRFVDTGLTYEEWRAGKTEVEKAAENARDWAKEKAKQGKDLVEDVGKSLWKAGSSWF